MKGPCPETIDTIMWFDMRAPSFGTSPQMLYAAALEMASWGDRQGVSRIMLSEHHGSSDGFLPAPTVLAAAMSAVTERIRFLLGAVILPLHHPVELAEHVAVLDQISNGRIELVIGSGYLPKEFGMFGRSLSDRARLVEEGTQLLTRALEGENIASEGISFTVTPRPVQRPRPPIFMGGGVPAAARRAARLADGYFPSVPDPALVSCYFEECRRLDRTPGPVLKFAPPLLTHVAEDPEKAWAQIVPHAMHTMNSYANWTAESGVASPFDGMNDAESARAAGLLQVVTPKDCVALVRGLHAAGLPFIINPLMGGIAPELAWSSLELLEQKVFPELQAHSDFEEAQI